MLFCLPSYKIPALAFSDLQLKMKKFRNQTISSELRILLPSNDLLFCLTSKKARKPLYYIETQIKPWQYHCEIIQTMATLQSNPDAFLIKRKTLHVDNNKKATVLNYQTRITMNQRAKPRGNCRFII